MYKLLSSRFIIILLVQFTCTGWSYSFVYCKWQWPRPGCGTSPEERSWCESSDQSEAFLVSVFAPQLLYYGGSLPAVNLPYSFNHMPQLLFFWLVILVQLLFEGSAYLVGKPVNSNNGWSRWLRKCMIKFALHHTYVVLHIHRVCIVITSCSWSNGYGLMLQLGLGLGTGNAYFLYLKKVTNTCIKPWLHLLLPYKTMVLPGSTKAHHCLPILVCCAIIN